MSLKPSQYEVAPHTLEGLDWGSRVGVVVAQRHNTCACVLCAAPQPPEELRSPKRVKESPRENTETDISDKALVRERHSGRAEDRVQ